MNMKQLRALIDAGLTDDQILSVISSGKPAGDLQKQESKEKPAGDPQKQESKEKPDVQQQILAAITGLTETIQASNIAGAKNKEPESVEEMLEGLITAD